MRGSCGVGVFARRIASLFANTEDRAGPNRAARGVIAALAWLALLASAGLPAGPARADDDLHTDPVLVLEPGTHTATTKALDADREGRVLVTASDDKTVRVWSAADGALLRTMRLPAGPGDIGKAYAVAISPDGALVAAGGWTAPVGVEQSVYLFDVATGRMVRRVGGLPGAVNHLAFSPDGQRLAVAVGGWGVRLVDSRSGEILARHEEYGGVSYGVAFDSNGRLATTSYDGRVRLYDPDLRLLGATSTPGGEQPAGIAFSPDGARFAVGYHDAASVDVFDAEWLRWLFAVDTAGMDGGGSLGKVAWSPDGDRLLAAGSWRGGSDMRIVGWADRGRGARQDHWAAHDTIMGLASLPDGRLAIAAHGQRLALLGPDRQEIWAQAPVTNDFRGQAGLVRVAPDGGSVAFRHDRWDDARRRWDMERVVLSLAARRFSVGPAPVGLGTPKLRARGLAVRDWEDGDRPTLNGSPLGLDEHETSRGLAFAPDGRHFALGTEWLLRLFGRDGRQIWRRDVPGVVWAVNITGDGRLLVAAYGDGTIRWHRLEDGAELLAFYAHPDRARWVLWTPEGYYDAPMGAEGLIGWHVNRGWDQAPEFHAAGSSTAAGFRGRFHRPDVIDLILRELDVERAVERADREASGPAAVRTSAD